MPLFVLSRWWCTCHGSCDHVCVFLHFILLYYHVCTLCQINLILSLTVDILLHVIVFDILDSKEEFLIINYMLSSCYNLLSLTSLAIRNTSGVFSTCKSFLRSFRRKPSSYDWYLTLTLYSTLITFIFINEVYTCRYITIYNQDQHIVHNHVLLNKNFPKSKKGSRGDRTLDLLFTRQAL